MTTFVRALTGTTILALLTFRAAAAQGAGQNTAPAAARPMRAADVDTIPLRTPGMRIAYGPDSLHFGDLRLPSSPSTQAAGERVPLVIVVHGGCWISSYATLRNAAPLADALAASGVASWNIEYRRADHPGGGWPGTFLDVARAADHVRTLARLHPIDTSRVIVAGHSAGGHLALWLASRRTQPANSPLHTPTPLAIHGVVSIGGVADLSAFAARPRDGCTRGGPMLLGDALQERLPLADPARRLPLGVPSRHIAGRSDGIAPLADRERFAAAARAAGDRADVITVDGGHFEVMAPTTEPGRATVRVILELLEQLAAPKSPPR